jgi:ApbE superfamily uncharacterized protein (UPF0280 family)
MAAERTALDHRRWHLNHGPIDIVAEAYGDAVEVAVAHELAWRRFRTLLDELVSELPLLRQPVGTECALRGSVARRMWQACAPFSASFITPMAAVAGAVAQELVGCFARPGIERAWINNGGDIALHLAPGHSVRVGVFADIARFDPGDSESLTADGQFEVRSTHPVRGIATSGWRGRSFSLGVADSVTVLAATAAEADAAATVIANAVNVDDPAIHRLPANECRDDSDLGDRLVTRGVGPLAPAQVCRALDAGVARAEALQRAGLVWSVALVCQGQWRMIEPLSSPSSSPPLPSSFPRRRESTGASNSGYPIEAMDSRLRGNDEISVHA